MIGDTVRRQLLGAEGGVGTRIRIGGVPFRIVGVLARVGTQLSRDGFLIDDHVPKVVNTVGVTPSGSHTVGVRSLPYTVLLT